ncbi:Gmad2 immunoglobulin-like domain-containing protein [Marininema halotolerans]|uniref:Immunoglobulin-like domain of spore germination n=1 Tax=Marininema halotolerans TaxID=1155944 RepID=A0A1I6RE99_9BACL|nr:Gmad2 immunoglobulin-like domain-containing protein [Marininema halotolerans]SFS63033.1 Immunoglobulin-like domain of spore germination [Marininema halotolerans]
MFRVRVGMLVLLMVVVLGFTFDAHGTWAKENSAFRNVSKGSPSVEYVITGKARVWEGTYLYRVKDGKKIISNGFGTASVGAPEWGDFKQVITLPKSPSAMKKTLKVEIYEESMKDGTAINKLTLSLKKGKFSEANSAFKKIAINDPKVTYSFKGEARVFEGVYHYAISDGHNYLAKGYGMASAGGPEWGAFSKKVRIPLSKMPVNGTLMLELYEESAKDGQPINNVDMLLDQLPWN